MNKIDPSLYLSNQNISREPKPTIDKDGIFKNTDDTITKSRSNSSNE